MKTIFSLVFVLALNVAAQAQFPGYVPLDHTARKVNNDDVPANVRVSFFNSVKGVVPSWTRDSSLYMASYTDSVKVGHIITYNADGQLMSSQEQQGLTAYPAPIEKFHDTHFPHEPFTVWKITDASGNSMYYFTRDKKTIWFDPRGELVDVSKNKAVRPNSSR